MILYIKFSDPSLPAKEINAQCRQLIFDHAAWVKRALGGWAEEPCVFGDMMDIIPPNSFNPENTFRQKFLDIDEAPFNTMQYCYRCKTLCPLFPEKASDLELAGLPCVDQSKAGKQKFREGRTGPIFVVHAKYHAEKKTPLLVLENAQEKRGR